MLEFPCLKTSGSSIFPLRAMQFASCSFHHDSTRKPLHGCGTSQLQLGSPRPPSCAATKSIPPSAACIASARHGGNIPRRCEPVRPCSIERQQLWLCSTTVSIARLLVGSRAAGPSGKEALIGVFHIRSQTVAGWMNVPRRYQMFWVEMGTSFASSVRANKPTTPSRHIGGPASRFSIPTPSISSHTVVVRLCSQGSGVMRAAFCRSLSVHIMTMMPKRPRGGGYSPVLLVNRTCFWAASLCHVSVHSTALCR